MKWNCAALVAFSCLLFSAATAVAHPIHASTAEADYNRATQKLELAVRVFADDLETALTERNKRRISVDKTSQRELEPLLREYVSARFQVKSASGQAVALKWIGRELKEASNEIWLFFEAHLPDGLDGVVLHHALLSECFTDQINTIQVRDGPRKTTLVFLASHREKRVRFRPE